MKEIMQDKPASDLLVRAKAFAFKPFGVFSLAFIWALMAGFVLQWMVLPALPELHAGNGLLKGGDWVRFHREAAELAALMQHQGWRVWELRPLGNAPIGITAAVYSLTGIFEPWVTLPVNAAMFGLAAVCLYTIFKALAPDRLAFVAIFPFVLFPSATLIYGQIQKDVFSIAGTFLIALVWVRFAERAEMDWRKLVARGASVAVGCLLVWTVRPYLMQSLIAMSLLVIALLAVTAGRGRGRLWWTGLLLCMLVQVGYTSLFSASSEPTVPALPSTSAASLQGSYLERMVAKLNAARVGFADGYPNAGSNIDTEVRFNSPARVAPYVPRALQVGLLAPFPSMWLGDGVSPGGGVMRFISGMEMAVTYVLLVGVLVFLYRFKGNRPTLFTVVLIALVLTLLLALVVSNVGTLYRMRYGSWQILNGLGILGWCVLWRQSRTTRDCQ
ncbi:hypothetical protein [Polaromonas sp.]|uniref:hypothetical protein n=1 Tax=Polaromonas sp. TaxID=1869339 RepID=UPI003CA37183